MTEGKWSRLVEQKCRCDSSEVEPVEGLPNCLRCTTCGGWWALRVGALSDLDLLEREFPPKQKS